VSTGAQPPTPPGWYPDGTGQNRYWDGSGWTEFRQAPAAAVVPVPAMPHTAPGVAPAVQVYYGQPPQPAQAWPASGLYVAAAVINWVTLGIVIVATFGLAIVAAAWFIPMTIYIHKGARDRYKHTGLAVCTLLFCNVLGGILMLVEDSNRSDRPVR
jgi:hypothetical protein